MQGLYDKARKEKIKELRRLMQELISDGDEQPMEGSEFSDALEDAGSEVDVAEEEMDPADAEEGELPEEEEDELSAMRRDFFQPKASKAPRAGTAVMMAKLDTKPKRRPGGRGVV